MRLCLAILVVIFFTFTGNIAAGTFKNPAFLETGYDPLGVAAADFNKDGNLDLAYVDSYGAPTLHILIGDGDGTFTHGQDLLLPTGVCAGLSCAINTVDVTGDNQTDIVLGGGTMSQAKLSVYVGNGDGTFKAPVTSTFNGQSGSFPSLNALMGFGDVNGDGIVDVVAPDRLGSRLYVLLGNNTGVFSVKSTTTFYYTGQPVAHLTDINGDGKLDIIVVDPPPGGVTYELLGNGDGTFKQFTSYNSLASFFADVDGDGHPDLVSNFNQGQIQYLKGNPDGTFGNPVLIASFATDSFLAGIGDINRDGILDFILTRPAGIGVLLGKGALTYGSLMSTVAGSVTPGVYNGIAQGDFNNDGNLDLALGVQSGIVLLLGNGSGSFTSADFYDVGHTVGAVAVADFNGDKSADIAATVPATYPRILVGNASGSFTLAADQNTSYSTQTPSSLMKVGDFNGDGKKDLTILSPTSSYPFGQTFVLLGSGNSLFAVPSPQPTGPALIADVNTDNRSDLIFNDNSGNLQSLLGQANGTFSPVLTPLRSGGNVAAVGDVNNDGKADVILTGFPGFEVWLGSGTGVYSYAGTFAASDQNNAQTYALVDLDNDGNADLVLAPYPDPLSSVSALVIYYGNGDGTFQSASVLPMSHQYGNLIVADINADNKQDLIVSNNQGLAVIQNMGSRVFDQEEHFVAGVIGGIDVADLNGDGFPDIVASNSNGTTVTVLLNQPNGTSLEGKTPVGLFTTSPEPSSATQPVTLTLALSAPPGSGLPVPTGSVSFHFDGTFITTVPLINGTASYQDSGTLGVGAHAFLATYNGDQTYNSQAFAAVHTVTPPVYTTATSLTVNPSTVLASQTVRLTATVTSSVPVQFGTVTFLDGAATIGAKLIGQNGVAVLDTALLSAGTHNVTAVYQGYVVSIGNPATYLSSTSAPKTVKVNVTATTITASSQASSGTAGTVITFDAQVGSANGVPFGGVSFYDGTILLGTTSLLADGSTSFSTASLATGSHSVTAAFNANATYAASTSSAVIITISAAQIGLLPSYVATSVASSQTSSRLSTHVSTPNGIARGLVTFIDNGSIAGHATLDGSGNATLSLAKPLTGTHEFSSSFMGNSIYAPAVSPVLEEMWSTGPDFAVSADSSLIVSAGGNSNRVPLSVSADSGFRQSVSFQCSAGVPAGYKCEFTPAVVSASGISSLQIVPILSGRVGPSPTPFYGVGLLAICFTGMASKSNGRRVLALIILSTAIALGLSGCGNTPVVSSPGGVLSVRAISSTTVHSLQIIVNHSEK